MKFTHFSSPSAKPASTTRSSRTGSPDAAFAPPRDVAGAVSDAERAIAGLNRAAELKLMPLARLLLRTESIASSKVEGMQVDARGHHERHRPAGSGRRPRPLTESARNRVWEADGLLDLIVGLEAAVA